MVSVYSGTIAWVFTACGSTDSPDAYQLRIGTASGVYSVCACYAASVSQVSLRDLLAAPGTYYAMALGSLQTTPLYRSTELAFTLSGKAISVM